MFIVETQLSYGWENVWTDSNRVTGKETPTMFETKELAQAEIDEFFHDIEFDSEVDLESYSRDDYRITEVK